MTISLFTTNRPDKAAGGACHNETACKLIKETFQPPEYQSVVQLFNAEPRQA